MDMIVFIARVKNVMYLLNILDINFRIESMPLTRRYKIIAGLLGTSRAVARIGCAAARKRGTLQTATIYSATVTNKAEKDEIVLLTKSYNKISLSLKLI